MESNFVTCPHCALKGKTKSVQPSTRSTPLVSRSDSEKFHVYLEETIFHRESGNPSSQPEIWALFRYDLDPKNVKAESTGVVIPGTQEDEEKLEEAADLMARMLAEGRVPQRQYRLAGGRLIEMRSSHLPRQGY